MTDLFVLAHAGEGATWQALVTMLSLGVMVVFVLVVLGRVTLERPDDALLPLAGVAVLAALAPSFSDSLSDWIGWALPTGAVLLVALGLHLFSPLSLKPPGVLAGGTAAAAVVASLLLYGPIIDAWHPPLVFAPEPDDAAIMITAPVEGEQLSAQDVTVEVAVTGATLLPTNVEGVLPDDPEELARINVLVDGLPHQAQFRESCTAAFPCTVVSFDVRLDLGSHEISVELLTAGGLAFSPFVFDTVTFDVAPTP